MTIAIKIENLSKQYRLGLVSTRTLSHDLNRWYQTTIRGKDDPYLKIGEVARERGSERSDEIFNTKTPRREENNSSLRLSASAVEDKSEITNHKSLITNPFSRPTPHAPCPMPSSDYIWALRDINLEVKQGEVLGIIGKNGAGKSTLLKILSKVTAPTTGTIKAKGRIASLLEVGTGFHPEMTGRENIYMNGAIMGMNKAEITRKLDEIVDFAGVETFIDTPVKRYSSGMTVRLGFAVAAHLEPEILVVDEVLAVGDAEFQKKAIGKMQEISKGEGRTVLFVSHNLGAVNEICTRAVLLRNGAIALSGFARDVVFGYLSETSEISFENKWETNCAPGNDSIKLRKAYLVNSADKKISHAYINQEIGFCVEYEVLREIAFFTHGINVYDSLENHLFTSHNDQEYRGFENVNKGNYRTVVRIPGNLLQNGSIILSFACMRYSPFQVLFHEKNLIQVNILDTTDAETRNDNYKGVLPGLIRPKLKWDKTAVLN